MIELFANNKITKKEYDYRFYRRTTKLIRERLGVIYYREYVEPEIQKQIDNLNDELYLVNK